MKHIEQMTSAERLAYNLGYAAGSVTHAARDAYLWVRKALSQ